MLDFLKGALKSIWRFYWKLVLINAVIGYGLAILWFFDLLGPDCRYDGNFVQNCFFLGMNIDFVSEFYLTMWAIPIMGPIGGVLMPFVIAFTVTPILWPIFYAAKLGYSKIIDKKQSS
jgi:hypothetical protein